MADIEIPILEIADGWDIDQVLTLDDCDDAEAFLTKAVVQIEMQLELDRADGFKKPASWRISAGAALKFKKRMLPVVARKRGQIGRRLQEGKQASHDRQLLDVVKRDFPDQFHAAVSTFIAERGGQTHG